MTYDPELLDDPLELAIAAYRRAYVGEAPAPSRELAALLGLETPVPTADPVPAPEDRPRLRLAVGSAAIVLAVGGLGFAGALPAAAQDLFDRVVTTLTPLHRSPEPRSVVPPDAGRPTTHQHEPDATHDDPAVDAPAEQPGRTDERPARHRHPAAHAGSTDPAGSATAHPARPSDGQPGPASPNRPPNKGGDSGSSSGSSTGSGSGSSSGNDDEGNEPDDDTQTTTGTMTSDDDAQDSTDGQGGAGGGQDSPSDPDDSEDSATADDAPQQDERGSDQE